MLKIFGLSFVSRPFARRCLAIFASQCLCANAFAASVLPTGGQYVAGQGTIATAPKGVVVNQSSTHGIVNWQGFSIGAGNTVQFNNGSGATLNRVTGGNLSQIDGVLKATGSVYLINPQGIVVGSGGKIVTKGSFVGSTRDVNGNDFMNGSALHATGTSGGNVVNQGSITSQYGDTILIGNNVSNSGSISAPNGTAGMAAGNDVLLRSLGSDPRIAVSSGHGNVTNTGTIAATQAELAAAGGNVYALAGNNGGLVSATGTKTVDGHVWLTSGGTTQISGSVTAMNGNGSGGTIVATGKAVQVDSTARISASGTSGGTVLLGGDQRGGSDPSAKRVSAAVTNAQTATIAHGAQISVDGTQGAGGAVVVWSDDHTIFDASISATSVDGNGGDAEVSSHGVLDFTGLVDLTSRYADTGNLLLDPFAVTIVSGTGGTISSGVFKPTANSNLGATTLTNALASANVTVNTGTSGSGTGSITLNSGVNLTWTSGSTLTLDASARAGGTIALNGAITATNGGLNIKAGASATVTDTAAINVGNFIMTSGNWSQSNVSLPSFAAANFVIDGGSFLRVTGGNGAATPYKIADIYGLQGMLGFTGSNFSLANDIDASSTANWNGGAGFVPLLLNSGLTFDGQSHSITGLTINQPSGYGVGLFGINYGTIQNLNLVGGSIYGGGGNVGAVAGQNGNLEADLQPDGSYLFVSTPGYIKNVTSSATVTGAGYGVGGLVGFNEGSVTNSSASGAVIGSDGSDGNYAQQVGGLVGSNYYGTIDASSASGNVTGYTFIGGLVGSNSTGASITNSHASGTITGPFVEGEPTDAGGLVGENDGLIDTAYATGDVIGINDSTTGSGNWNYGGLVGLNLGSIANAHASGSVTGQSSVGGLVGGNGGSPYYGGSYFVGTITNSYATGIVTGATDVGGLVGANGGPYFAIASTIDNSYATATVNGNAAAGGLVGHNYSGASITNSHSGGTVNGITSAGYGGYVYNSYGVGGLIGENDGSADSSYSIATVSAPGGSYVGGFTGNDGGSITNSYASGAVSGDSYVGGFAGDIYGSVTDSYATGGVTITGYDGGGFVGTAEGTVTNAYATGTITPAAGSSPGGLGGFVGYNASGTISSSYATGDVLGGDASDGSTYTYEAGGFAGGNYGTITLSHATGKVTGYEQVGGLVGWNGGTVSQSYATGQVAAGMAGYVTVSAGGLVGENDGTITLSYATGNVSSPAGNPNTDPYDFGVGGLVGYNNGGSISQSYATGTASGTLAVGGLVGFAQGGSIQNAYATGAVSGWSMVGGLVGDNELGSITHAYATGSASGAWGDVGGLVGANGEYGGGVYAGYGPGMIADSYWNTDVIGTGIGYDTGASTEAAGLTTAQFLDSNNFSGFDFTNIWSPAGNGYKPELYGVSYVLRVDASGTFQYGDPLAPTYYGLQNGDGTSVIQGVNFTTDAVGMPQVGHLYTASASGGTATSSSGNAYRFIYNNGPVTITPREVTVQADSVIKTYGDVDPALTYQLTSGSLLSGDNFTGSLTRQAGNNAGSYNILQGSLAVNANYQITFLGASFTINPATLTYTANAAERTYGGANPTFTGTVTGFVNGETLTSATTGTAQFATTAANSANVGSYAINGSGLTANHGNYVLVQAAGNASALTIDPATLTYTANAATRTYGSPNPSLSGTLTGFVLGQTQSGVTSGTLRWTAGTTSTTADVGAYSINGGSLSLKSAFAGDYVFVQADSNATAFTITPKTLTWSVTGGSASGTYGTAGTLGTVGLTGFVTGDAAKVSGVTGLLDSLGNPVTYVFNTDAGTYSEIAASLTGVKALDYVLSPTGSAKSFAINPKSITYTTAAASGTYGVISSLGAVSLNGLVSGDSGHVSGTEGLFSGSTAVPYVFNTAAGTYTEKVTGLTGTKAGNYSIAVSGNTAGIYTINKATLTYTTADAGSTYGTIGTLGAITFSGLVAGDGSNVTGAEGLFSGSTAVPYVFNTNAGSYSEKVTGISGTGSSNYALASSGNTIGTFTISARPITVTADSLSRKYGSANPSLTYSFTSGALVAGDSLTGALATAADAHSNIGDYSIAQNTLSASANYTLTYVPGTLTVTARALDITADNLQRLYGDANPAFTYVVAGDGLANGDTLSGLLATSADGHSDVGGYAIGQGSLTASSNYSIAFTPGTLTVNARTLDISASDASRLYGDTNPAFIYAVGGDGLVNGDTLTGVLISAADEQSNVGDYAITQGSLAANSNYVIDYTGATLSVTQRTLDIAANSANRLYGDANPAFTYTVGGDGLVNGDTLSGALATSADAYSNVGDYAITQGTLAASGNYAIDYTDALLSVGARSLAVTADDLSRKYGNANPALTYVVGGDGLVNGDALSGGLATAADITSDVGDYAIAQGTLAASGNYVLNYTPGTLSVTARALTITGDDLSRLYGDANPALTYAIGGDGLTNGDALTGGLATAADTMSGIGNYAITQGTLAASPNYTVAYFDGTLAVTPRALTVSADDISRIYGDANPALTFVIGGGGLVNGDVLTGGLVTAANAASNIGGYAITQGSLAASSNYTVAYAPGTLTVTPRALTVSADDLSRIYGDANPALTYGITSGNLVNGDTLTGGLATIAGLTSNVGSYAVSQGSLAASPNYALTYVGGTLAITPRAITVTADDLGRIYGSTNPLLTYTVGGKGLVNGDTLAGDLATSASLHSNVGNYGITQGTLASSPNYILTFAPGTLTLTPAALLISADSSSALTLADAQPTASYSGLVAGDSSSVVSGLQLGLFPVTGNPFAYDIVPFGASAQNYTISYRGGLLTLTAQPSNAFTSPVTPGGALGTLPSLVLVTGSGTFTFSNVATAAIGVDTGILLFDVGLPGDIGTFSQFVITDYSNALDDSDRLVAAE